jgi:hypothetical protein
MSHQAAQTFSTQQQHLHHRRLATSGLTVTLMSCRHGQDLLGHLLLLQLRKDLAAQLARKVQQARLDRQDRVVTQAQQARELTLRDDTLRMVHLLPHNPLVLLETRT